MSTRALLKAVETRLRSAACLSDPDGKVVGVQPDGRPPAKAGQWYYAVHGAGVSQDDQNSLSHDRRHAVTVTITRRVAEIPRDRRGERLTVADELLDLAEQVGDWLHMDYRSMNAANALIPGIDTTTNGFVEPLKLQSITPVQEVGSEWVRGEDADGSDVFTVAVYLGGALRVRHLN